MTSSVFKLLYWWRRVFSSYTDDVVSASALESLVQKIPERRKKKNNEY